MPKLTRLTIFLLQEKEIIVKCNRKRKIIIWLRTLTNGKQYRISFRSSRLKNTINIKDRVKCLMKDSFKDRV